MALKQDDKIIHVNSYHVTTQLLYVVVFYELIG